MPSHRGPEPPAAVITDAEPGTSLDRGKRQRTYLISMGIRVACFILMILTPSPWRWAFLVGAAVIPPFAVMLANISSRARTPSAAPTEPKTELVQHQLTGNQVIPGEVADD